MNNLSHRLLQALSSHCTPYLPPPLPAVAQTLLIKFDFKGKIMQRANLQSTFMNYKLYCTILPGLRKKVYSFLSKNFSQSVNRQLILPRKERRRQGDKLMMYERWCEQGGAGGGGGGEYMLSLTSPPPLCPAPQEGAIGIFYALFIAFLALKLIFSILKML